MIFARQKTHKEKTEKNPFKYHTDGDLIGGAQRIFKEKEIKQPDKLTSTRRKGKKMSEMSDDELIRGAEEIIKKLAIEPLEKNKGN